MDDKKPEYVIGAESTFEGGRFLQFATAKTYKTAVKKRITLAGPYGEATSLRIYKVTKDGERTDVTDGEGRGDD